jgi:CMP-N,N'-diacetyllegionaminic acid synthase
LYKDKRVVCVIPARGGSKGLPGKNIKNLLGKPLISYSIEQAQESRYIDRVIVSTEDRKIAGIAKNAGAEVPFERPAELAQDSSSGIDVLLHAINWLENEGKYAFDILVLLHATAPLRTVEDIDKCIELLFEENALNVFSVTESHRNPYFNMVELHNDGKVTLVKDGAFVTRQSAPSVFDMNASIYVWWKDVLKIDKSIFSDKTYLYVMPKERSVDIDDELDFKIIEMLLGEGIIHNKKESTDL